ncbi:MAG: hypothetical protein WC551_13955 [Patescibacteria group bacterium]
MVKKASRGLGDHAELIDKIFAQVDPIVAAAGLLGAGMTAAGMTPPLTAIFSTIYNKEVQSKIVDVLTWSPVSQWTGMLLGQSGVVSWADLLTWNFGDVELSDREKARLKQGTILMGAFEAMVIMSLARNEAALAKFMELGGKIGSATITAAGEAVPF